MLYCIVVFFLPVSHVGEGGGVRRSGVVASVGKTGEAVHHALQHTAHVDLI